MIKTILTLIIATGLISTNSESLSPESIEICAGVLSLEITGTDLDFKLNQSAEFGLTLTRKNGGAFSLKL